MYIPEHRFVLHQLDKFLAEKEQEVNLFGRSLSQRELIIYSKQFWSNVYVRTDPHKDFAP